MSELQLFAAFLLLGTITRSLAPDISSFEFAASAQTDAGQMLLSCAFSTILTIALQLAKIFIYYRKFRSEYLETRTRMHIEAGSRGALRRIVLKRLATGLFFACVIALSIVREPLHPHESLMHFLILSTFVYVGVGAVVDTLKFLPLLVGRASTRSIHGTSTARFDGEQ